MDIWHLFIFILHGLLINQSRLANVLRFVRLRRFLSWPLQFRASDVCGALMTKHYVRSTKKLTTRPPRPLWLRLHCLVGSSICLLFVFIAWQPSLLLTLAHICFREFLNNFFYQRIKMLLPTKDRHGRAILVQQWTGYVQTKKLASISSIMSIFMPIALLCREYYEYCLS